MLATVSTVRTVYVSTGISEDLVRRSVDAWVKAQGHTLDVNIEFGDEYPGFATAVDVFGMDEVSTLDDARALAQELTTALAQGTVAVDVDLESAIAERTTSAG
mgnify:CR=1 FL=1